MNLQPTEVVILATLAKARELATEYASSRAGAKFIVGDIAIELAGRHLRAQSLPAHGSGAILTVDGSDRNNFPFAFLSTPWGAFDSQGHCGIDAIATALCQEREQEHCAVSFFGGKDGKWRFCNAEDLAGQHEYDEWFFLGNAWNDAVNLLWPAWQAQEQAQDLHQKTPQSPHLKGRRF